jgi:hypothetical protein
MPSTLTINREGKVRGLKTFDFSNPVHVERFEKLSMGDKRVYIGWYMRTNDEKRFLDTMLLARPAKSMKPSTIQRELAKINSGTINAKSVYDMIHFIKADYNPTSHFDMDGHTLLEVAAIMDAKRASGQSQRMLTKVLDDLHHLVQTEKYKPTILPKDTKLGYTILEHGQNSTRRQQTLSEIMKHPVMRGKAGDLIDTHHRHNGMTKHLANIARNKYGNTSTHAFIQNRVPRRTNRSQPISRTETSAMISRLVNRLSNTRLNNIQYQTRRSPNSPRSVNYQSNTEILPNIASGSGETPMTVQNRGRRTRNTTTNVTAQLNAFASIVNKKTRGPISVDNLLRAKELQRSINAQFNTLSRTNQARYSKLYNAFNNNNSQASTRGS